MAMLNPNLTSLRLDFCGRMDDTVAATWAESLPNLKRIELLGPFLVRVAGWQTFFRAHPNLEGFLITQSPRFDADCMRVLAESCPNLKELRLKEVGKMSDDFLECIKLFGGKLTYLDLSYPGTGGALTERGLIDMLKAVGGTLDHLDLSGNADVTDALLFQGIKPYALNLSTLVLADTPDLTDAGVAEFFGNWKGTPLSSLDMSRNDELADAALTALLKHSGAEMTSLNINGWKSVSEDALKLIPKRALALKKLDVGWCRCVDDWFVKSVLEECDELEELKVWGCGRLTEHCARKVSPVRCSCARVSKLIRLPASERRGRAWCRAGCLICVCGIAVVVLCCEAEASPCMLCYHLSVYLVLASFIHPSVSDWSSPACASVACRQPVISW